MIRINLEQLRTFLVVVRSGGVVKAAHALNLTQPAITARIKNLEKTLGAELFDRSSGAARLTKRGEMLMQYAVRLETLSNQIERDIVDPAGIDGRLRIGASETIAQSWLPDFILELHVRFPRLDIDIDVDVSVNLRDRLLAREIDLAFLLGPVSEYSVENLALPSFKLGWYTAVTDDPASIEARRLYGKPAIAYARNTRPFRELRDELNARIGPDVPIYPSSSLSAAFRLVETGLGVGALPQALAEPLIAEGRLVEFDPGWQPKPLRFTASWLADPPSHMLESAASIAEKVAERHALT